MGNENKILLAKATDIDQAGSFSTQWPYYRRAVVSSANAASGKSGFTLIELLVVIAIIALLASVVLVALNGARQKSRDAKRLADLNQFAKGLELYFNQNYTYPTLTVSGPLTSLSGSPTLTPTYLATMPATVNPADGTCATSGQGSNDYYYLANNNGNVASTYALTFCLGNTTGSLKAGPHTLTQAGFQ